MSTWQERDLDRRARLADRVDLSGIAAALRPVRKPDAPAAHPMKRSPMPARRTPMPRGGPLPHRRETARRQAIEPATTRRATVSNVVPSSIRAALWQRCGGRCEAMLPGCFGLAEHPHHRRLKSHGVDHSAGNLLAVCHRCHDVIHAHPEYSYAHRLMLRTGDDGPAHTGCPTTCITTHERP